MPEVAVYWLASRLTLFIYIVVATHLLDLAPGNWQTAPKAWAFDLLASFDSAHYLRIAQVGYWSTSDNCCDQAFFPGYPLAMRAVAPFFGGDVAIAGVAVAVIAGAVTAVLLCAVVSHTTGDARVGKSAALYLILAPYGVFLSAIYSESLFLAAALGAWWTAMRRHWWSAGIFAGLATAVRINGLFLTVALAVMYVLQLRADEKARPRRDAMALLIPLASVAAYSTYLYQSTGSWTNWLDAQKKGWQRGLAWPWDGLQVGWQAIRLPSAPHVTFSEWADFLTVVGGLGLIGILILVRRWPEAAYMTISVGVLVCSTTLTSSSRYALTWFPGFLLAAELTSRPTLRWLHVGVVTVCATLLATLSLMFATDAWVA